MEMRKIRGLIFVVFVMFVSGCVEMGNPKQAIDPPPMEEELRTPAPSLRTDPARWISVVALDDQGMRVPLSVHPPMLAKSTEQLAEAVVEWMTIGTIQSQQLPDGFRAVFPEKTTLNHVEYHAQKQLLVLDFSEPFSTYESSTERGMLESIAWSMAQLPGVDDVALHLQGKKIDVMPVDRTPVTRPLNENVGLNLDSATFGHPNMNRWEYVFQQKQTENGFVYQVPVYRVQDEEIPALKQEDESDGTLIDQPLNPWELE